MYVLTYANTYVKIGTRNKATHQNTGNTMTTTTTTANTRNQAKVTYAVHAAIHDTINNAPNTTTKQTISATLTLNNRQLPRAIRTQLPNTPQEAINTLTEWATPLEQDLNAIYPNGVNDPRDLYPHVLAYYKAIINRLQNN